MVSSQYMQYFKIIFQTVEFQQLSLTYYFILILTTFLIIYLNKQLHTRIICPMKLIWNMKLFINDVLFKRKTNYIFNNRNIFQ